MTDPLTHPPPYPQYISLLTQDELFTTVYQEKPDVKELHHRQVCDREIPLCHVLVKPRVTQEHPLG